MAIMRDGRLIQVVKRLRMASATGRDDRVRQFHRQAQISDEGSLRKTHVRYSRVVRDGFS